MAKYIREEEDGSVTVVHADECSGVMKTHNTKGPSTHQYQTKNKRLLSLRSKTH